MNQYKPIATYHLADDIIALFPCDRFKPDMGDIIYNRYKEGFGEPNPINEVDKSAWYDEQDIEEDNANFILTADKKHGVRFTRGSMERGVPIGFYIDIYELVEEGDDEPEFTDAQLKLIARERRAVDDKIKQVIIKEFKEHFKNPGEGLNFNEFCPDCVYGMLDETGDIGEMYLNEDGKIMVSLTQEYEDAEEEFESRYFACDNWAQLLINVRRGIKDEWLIENEDWLEEE